MYTHTDFLVQATSLEGYTYANYWTVVVRLSIAFSDEQTRREASETSKAKLKQQS